MVHCVYLVVVVVVVVVVVPCVRYPLRYTNSAAMSKNTSWKWFNSQLITGI